MRPLLVTYAGFAACLAPLVIWAYAPAVDLPSHLAIARVLGGLLGGDAVLSRWWDVNLQPVPYHLVYLLLVPLVALCGARWGGTLLLVAYGAFFLFGCRRLAREVGAPSAALVPLACLLYSGAFFWGFVASLVAVPLVIWGTWALLAHARAPSPRLVALACACGFLAGAAHPAMVPAWCAAVLAASRGRLAGAAIAAALVPLLPWLLGGGAGGALAAVDLFHPKTTVHYAAYQMRLFDYGAGKWSLWALLLLLVGGIAHEAVRTGLARWRAEHRFALRALGLFTLLYALAPLEVVTPKLEAWGLSFRYVVFIGVALALLYPRRAPRALAAAIAIAGLVHYGALYAFWQRTNTEMRALEPVLARMEPGRTLAVTAATRGVVGSSWAPVLRHAHAWYGARGGGAFDTGLFAGGHVPIRARAALDPSDCDYLLLQDDGELTAAPPGRRSVIRSGRFELFAR